MPDPCQSSRIVKIHFKPAETEIVQCPANREKTFGNSGHNAEIVSAIISGGQYEFQSFDDGPAEQDIIFNTSVWEINFGLRYDF